MRRVPTLLIALAALAAAPGPSSATPPPLGFTPDRGGGGAQACGGDVLCVGPSEMYLTGSKVTVRHNLIRHNTVGEDVGYGWGGGGIFFGPGEPVPHARFESNRWVGNTAPSHGSALFVDDYSTAKLVGELMHGNPCPDEGGAFYVDGGGEPAAGSRAILDHVTIAGNKCQGGNRAGAIFMEGGSSVKVVASIIFGNGGASAIEACIGCADGEPEARPSTIAHSVLDGKLIKVKRGAGVQDTNPRFDRDFRPKRALRSLGAYAH